MRKIPIILALLAPLLFVYTGSALECMLCHQSDQNGGAIPLINTTYFGVHVNVNTTDGIGNLTSLDCIACHYSANNSSFHTIPVLNRTCEDCHINGIVPAAPRVNNHDRNANITVTAFCSDCHNKTSNLFRFNANASAAHYGRNASFGFLPSEAYCAYCHENSSTIYRDVMQNPNNTMMGNHTSGRINSGHLANPNQLAGGPDCTTCHGLDRIHGPNLTKPVPNSTFCNNCHKNDPIQKDRHAGKVECINCHADTPRDIHNIEYLLQNGTYRGINATGCTDCHNFGGPGPFFRVPFPTSDCTTCHVGNGLLKFSNASHFSTPLNHSQNPASGGLWNGTQPGYWNQSQVNACYYCHGSTLHNTTALGNISNIKAGNALNQSITNTSFWCANCHYNGSVPTGNYSYNGTSLNPVPPEIQNKTRLVPARASDGTAFFNHSLSEYSDATCKLCHSVNSPVTSALFIHNVGAGGGGTDCLSCHQNDIGSFPSINISSFGMHVNVNSTDGIGNLTKLDCIACHYSANTSGFHTIPVATYTCENCHIEGIIQAAPRVNNHNRNANVSVNATCSNCHNKTSNLFKFSANASAAHYGRNASFGISPGEPYCAYCHENSSTIYKDVMQNPNNSMMGNHTSGRINSNHTANPNQLAGGPDCTTCHGLDRIHGANLTKPVPNSTFCNNCHKNDPIKKDRHAGKVECIRCHADTPRDIHNIEYLTPNGTYQSINATGCTDCHNFGGPGPFFRVPFPTANCTTCHTGNGQIRFAEAPHVAIVINHSSNPSSGGLWNSTPGYWNNQSQISSCYYCHGNTLHDTVPLGNASNIKAGNALNQSIANTSFWCANCHYQGVPAGNYSYNGTSLNPVPPEIQNKTGLVPSKATDGTSFFNHSLSEYSDATCKLCHSVNSPVTSALFIHNVNPAAGGTDCISCHKSPMGVFPALNISAFGVHVNVNITDGIGNLTNLDCMTCHFSANTPGSHPMSNYTCENCHIEGIVPTASRVSNHNRNANVSVNAACILCHNKTSNLFIFNANTSAAHYGRNASFGISPGEPYCAYCHENSSTIYIDVMNNSNNSMLGNHTFGRIKSDHPANPGYLAGGPDCTTCHGNYTIHNASLTKPVPNSVFCNNCHLNDTIKKDRHAGKVECINCHADTPRDIHNIEYLLQNGTYRGINATGCTDCHNFGGPGPFFRVPFPTADCTTCHTGNGQIQFAEAPLVAFVMNHSSNNFSGGLWNGSNQTAYWNNQSQISSCYYCHGNTLHDTVPLGNASNIKAGNALNQSITNTSFWCANCHYQGVPSGNYSYNGTSLNPVPPEIQNKTGLVPARANDGSTSFFNHSLTEYSDATCILCHGTTSNVTSALFMHNVNPGGGGPNCISCHDIKVAGGAPADKKIDVTAFNNSVHSGLNTGGNAACWACHGDGTRPTGHPSNYKSPKKCSNDECHSLDQKFKAPMIYSHFRNASLNANPTGAFNHNVTTSNDCQDCHINSVNSGGRNINSTVSHFASNNLFDSINCIYCHTNEDNSKSWGNATLIYKNRTTLVELDRENNRFIVREGETIDLGPIFSLRVLEISSVRESALIELIKENVSVDTRLIGIGNYTYEEYLTIDNGSTKVPVIVINVTGIFKGNNTNELGFIQFGGFRLKRVHPEDKSTSCISCHVYSSPKIKYKVIERVSGDKDEIFYTSEMVNFTDKNVFNETTVLGLLEAMTDTDLHVNIQPEKRRSLYEGETWNIAEGTSLMLKGVDTKSEVVFLQLHTGDYYYEDIVKKGGIFEFNATINYLGNQPKNITLFRATVTGIVQGTSKNMAIIEDAVDLSPEIKKIEVNQTIAGYNTSWLWENSTINIGKIPENFHSPQLLDGANGGANCLSCHGKDGFSEKKVLLLGKHDLIDGGGNNACYACHGGTKDIKEHPPGFKTPRDCLSCHASTQDNYSAVYIGDEEHRFERCVACHVSNIHDITALHVTPSVKQISLVKEGSRNLLKATATAGYKMRLRAARYYIDSPDEKITMSPVDGTFDSQKEDVFAEIDVSKLSPGKHIVYVEAMERKDNWGVPASFEFTIENGTIENGSLKSQETKTSGIPLMAYVIAALLVVFVLRRFGKV